MTKRATKRATKTADVHAECACGVGDAVMGGEAGRGRRAVGVDPASKDRTLKRLRRIEGQVRGLQRMVENDEYCIEILTQVSAATKALQSVAVGLLDEHLRHCVAGAVAAGDEAQSSRMIGEATNAIDRLVKS